MRSQAVDPERAVYQRILEVPSIIAEIGIAILDPDVEVAVDRVARAGQQLPGEAAVVEQLAVDQVGVDLDLGIADPAADEDVDILRPAEVEQHIAHRRPGRGMAVVVEAFVDAALAVLPNVAVAMRHPFVGDLTLDPDHPEIVTGNQVDVIADVARRLEIV